MYVCIKKKSITEKQLYGTAKKQLRKSVSVVPPL